MSNSRIVVTGIGASSPIGGTAPESWTALLAGTSGARTLEYEWVEQYDLPVTFAAEALVRPDTVLERPEAKRLDPASQFALVAAREAWADAGTPDVAPERFGVDFATGIGGVWTLLDAWDTLREKGPRRVMPMTRADADAECRRGGRLDAPRRPCVRSHRGIGVRLEHRIDRERARAPAARSGRRRDRRRHRSRRSTRSPWRRSRRCRRSPSATTTRRHASRPYSVDRDGFVMGEGAAAVVLETEEHAHARGAKIYAVVVGGGVTADSYHITAPEPEGLGASRAVRMALEAAGASVDDVTHINAHATSTPTGDIAEYKALLSVFGDRVHEIPVSATKASTGHLLGGTGALEAIFTILALRDGQAPPTINLTTQDPEIPLRVSGSPIPLGSGPQLAISNSFGFGGHNAVVAFATA